MDIIEYHELNNNILLLRNSNGEIGMIKPIEWHLKLSVSIATSTQCHYELPVYGRCLTKLRCSKQYVIESDKFYCRQHCKKK